MAYKYLVKLGAIGFACLLLCITISNLSVFSPNWPFALFASFSGTLILTLPVVLAVLFMSWRKALLPMTLLALFAFYPFYSFKDFVVPTEYDCTAGACVSVVAANLRHHPDALIELAATEAKDADILIIVEFPNQTTSDDLLALFPMDGKAQVAFLSDKNIQIGSRMAVMSRKPLADVRLNLHQFPLSNLSPRGIINFDYIMTSGAPLSFAVVHPPPPKGGAETSGRDEYLAEAAGSLFHKTNAIMIGDFNMTPWESGFTELPGKRVGNPRWNRTWNARKFWQHIAIDHALISETLAVSEFDVLPDVGSDHFPIRMVIHEAPHP